MPFRTCCLARVSSAANGGCFLLARHDYNGLKRINLTAQARPLNPILSVVISLFAARENARRAAGVFGLATR